ncbi:MAG: hypothetical protein AB9866_18985 [Syntrophobacteraceae bacterium]
MSLAISYTFSPTTTIESAQVNQNFTDIVNYFNTVACVPNMVVGWKGSVASIPTGWTLDADCRDKFLLGAGNLYAVGAAGGSITHPHANSLAVVNAGELQQGTGGHSSSVGFGSGASFVQGHGHSLTGGVTDGGSLPPYYALCWIRKT